MTPRTTFVVNYVAYQTGWLAVVLGAASGHAGAGAATGAVLTLLHLGLARDRAGEALLVGATLVTGLAVEWWQIAQGTYRLLAQTPAAVPPPLWLLILWAQFATTFRFSLARVMLRPCAAALFGAIGGPIAFLAGERFGAVVLWAPVAPGVLRLSAGWAIGLMWLSILTVMVARRRPGSGYRGSAPTSLRA